MDELSCLIMENADRIETGVGDQPEAATTDQHRRRYGVEDALGALNRLFAYYVSSGSALTTRLCDDQVF